MCIKPNLQETVKAFRIGVRAWGGPQGARVVNIWKSTLTQAAFSVRGALCCERTGFPSQWNLQIDETSLRVGLDLRFITGRGERREFLPFSAKTQTRLGFYRHFGPRFWVSARRRGPAAEGEAFFVFFFYTSGNQRLLAWATQLSSSSQGSSSVISPHRTAQRHSRLHPISYYHDKYKKIKIKKYYFWTVIRYRASLSQYAAWHLIAGQCGFLIFFFFLLFPLLNMKDWNKQKPTYSGCLMKGAFDGHAP